MTTEQIRKAMREQFDRAEHLYVKREWVARNLLYTSTGTIRNFMAGRPGRDLTEQELETVRAWLDECERGEHDDTIEDWQYKVGTAGCNIKQPDLAHNDVKKRTVIQHNLKDGIKGAENATTIGNMTGCEEECKGCSYLAPLYSDGRVKFCDYMNIEGHMRGCQSGAKYCLHYDPDGKRRQRRKALTVRDNDPAPVKQPSKREMEDQRRMELYKQGLNDREIAEAIGTRHQVISKWRLRRGLPANGKLGRPKKNADTAADPQEAENHKEDTEMNEEVKPAEYTADVEPVTAVRIVEDADLTNEINQFRRERDALKDRIVETDKALEAAKKYIEELEKALKEHSENLNLANKKIAVAHAEATEAKEIVFRLVKQEMGLE